MTDTNAMPIGRVVAPGEYERLVQEKLARLLDATARDPRLLTQDEVDALRRSARTAVDRRLRGASVAGSRQLADFTGSVTDLWTDPTVRAVRDADDLDAELADVRTEFRTASHDVDPQ